MPLYKSFQPASDVRVYIWKIEESESWLSRDVELTPHCQRRVEGMQSELHRRGFLSIRHLMAEAGYTDSDLYYDKNGKPHLKDGTHISITHSFEFTGIILSGRHEVGIDIEKQRNKILRIAHRFTTLREYQSVANEEALVRKLTMIWGAKESLYKIMGIPGVSFLDHICVADFELGQEGATARVMFEGRRTDFETFFLEFEGFTCVYALQNPAAAP
jgi:phosphopantetheinyl transferase